MSDCTQILECLACGNSNLVLTLDLGTQPLANNFRNTESTENEPRYPLAVNRCTKCNHLQLTHVVDPHLIYTHYLYVSGTSVTLREYSTWFAHFVREQFTHWTTSILDIGCNDGSQLDAFKELAYQTYGVDPAENLWPTSSAKHNVVCGYWDEDSAATLGRDFDAIIAQNSFAHNPTPLIWLQLAKQYLKNDGKIFISTSQADMVINGEFETIYHEHISYYNAESMRQLAERAGLYLVDVVKTPIHGTSYIFVLAKQPRNEYRMANILATEATLGLNVAITYTTWANNVAGLLSTLKEQLNEYKAWKCHIIGYGAAAKGMTLLNAGNIHLDAVIDDNPLKQGLYCPGTDIPVVSSDYIKQIPATDKVVFVPLAWNFYPEIVKKIRTLRNNKDDMFVKYFPKLSTETYDS